MVGGGGTPTPVCVCARVCAGIGRQAPDIQSLGGFSNGPWMTGAPEGAYIERLRQADIRREEVGGFWTRKFVYQKWPNRIFPTVNFVFSHDGHFGLGGGGVEGLQGGLLLWLSAGCSNVKLCCAVQ